MQPDTGTQRIATQNQNKARSKHNVQNPYRDQTHQSPEKQKGGLKRKKPHQNPNRWTGAKISFQNKHISEKGIIDGQTSPLLLEQWAVSDVSMHYVLHQKKVLVIRLTELKRVHLWTATKIQSLAFLNEGSENVHP